MKTSIGIGDRDDLAVALLMAVGYATETPLHPGRRPVERNVFTNTYGMDA